MFDAHAHYDDKLFDPDRDALLSSMPEKGVSFIVNAGDSLASSKAGVALAEKYPFIYAAVGVHPHNAKDFTSATLSELEKMCENRKVVAIGEIGLDYHYEFSPRDVQKKVFKAQIDFAREQNLPIVIHEREALRDTLDVLEENKCGIKRALWHCFSQSTEILKEVMDLDCFYISLGGVVTFKNAVKAVEVAKAVPLDRLLLETDCPYLTPVPFRGKRNDSSYMKYTAEKIAQIRGISYDELCAKILDNARHFYEI